MKHGSLFSGIGGFDLAAEWMGWDNVFHCEWMPFPRKVLHHYWPNAASYHDITTTDFTAHAGQIDILTGGFPCQPYSAAGKRKGKDDDRHLWPHMLRCIREVKPRWVVGENVFGLATWNGGLVFEEVCAELEAEGYAVQPFVLTAAAVNAPHRRDRVWFVAYDNLLRCEGHEQQIGDWLHNTIREGNVCFCEKQGRNEIWGFNAGNCKTGDAADAMHSRLQRRQEVDGWKERNIQRTGNGTDFRTDSKNNKWQRESNFQNFPTQSPICGGDDGLPAQLDGITFPKWRAESIKGYGNAIVPQVALQIFKAIQQYEELQR